MEEGIGEYIAEIDCIKEGVGYGEAESESIIIKPFLGDIPGQTIISLFLMREEKDFYTDIVPSPHFQP